MTSTMSPPSATIRRETCDDDDSEIHLEPIHASTYPDQEWANALTHGLAAIAMLAGSAVLYWRTFDQSWGTIISCQAFVVSALSVFVASTLSHTLMDKPQRLKRLRAWDQGLIYMMITGTYTPIIYEFADANVRGPLLIAVWIAAVAGFWSKVFAEHRIRAIGTVTYLALGWIPALFLIGRVNQGVLVWMTFGGIVYTIGVAVLMNDSRRRYMHALWHLLVMAAAGCHFWAIYKFVAASV